MAIQQLQKPTRHGEKINIDVNDYLDFFNFKHKSPSDEGGLAVTNSFTSITLTALQYRYGDVIDIQWEFDL